MNKQQFLDQWKNLCVPIENAMGLSSSFSEIKFRTPRIRRRFAKYIWST